MTVNETETRAPRRAPRRYGARVNLNLPPATARALEAAADEAGVAVGTMAREAVEAGLTRALAVHRKRAQGGRL